MYQWNVRYKQVKKLPAVWPLYAIRWLPNRRIMAVKSFDLIAMIIDAKTFSDSSLSKSKEREALFKRELSMFLAFLAFVYPNLGGEPFYTIVCYEIMRFACKVIIPDGRSKSYFSIEIKSPIMRIQRYNYFFSTPTGA